MSLSIPSNLTSRVANCKIKGKTLVHRKRWT